MLCFVYKVRKTKNSQSYSHIKDQISILSPDTKDRVSVSVLGLKKLDQHISSLSKLQERKG